MTRIEPFRAELATSVIELILPIQQIEFGVPITLDDQPDLLRIPEVYQSGRGGFWVALADRDVVGTIGLVDFGGGGALRKMFLRADQRGNGLAQRLLDMLLAHARAEGIAQIVLGTTSQMRAAQRFYEKNGFRATAPDALPIDYPRMRVDDRFYALTLRA